MDERANVNTTVVIVFAIVAVIAAYTLGHKVGRQDAYEDYYRPRHQAGFELGRDSACFGFEALWDEIFDWAEDEPGGFQEFAFGDNAFEWHYHAFHDSLIECQEWNQMRIAQWMNG